MSLTNILTFLSCSLCAYVCLLQQKLTANDGKNCEADRANVVNTVNPSLCSVQSDVTVLKFDLKSIKINLEQLTRILLRTLLFKNV